MLGKIFTRLINSLKRRLSWRNLLHFPSCIKVQSPHVTLKHCENLIVLRQTGAYLRFGDGDINLACGQRDSLQECSKELQAEMREAFAMSGPGIVKALPIHSLSFGVSAGMCDGMFLGSDLWCNKLLSKVFEYFIGVPIYSSVALHYAALFSRAECIDFLVFLKKCNPIFVGNEDVPKDILTMLFGDTVHIRTPARSAYSDINRVEKDVVKEILSKNDYTVICLAMGCAGRILQKRLLDGEKYKGLFVYDFGSLMDAFCGIRSRGWMDLALVTEDYYANMLSEVGRS